MDKFNISSLFECADPFIRERCGEVSLMVERHAGQYPAYAENHRAYQAIRTRLELAHPSERMELDEMISFLTLAQANISHEIYKQGARDCAMLLRTLFSNDKPVKEDEP